MAKSKKKTKSKVSPVEKKPTPKTTPKKNTQSTPAKNKAGKKPIAKPVKQTKKAAPVKAVARKTANKKGKKSKEKEVVKGKGKKTVAPVKGKGKATKPIKKGKAAVKDTGKKKPAISKSKGGKKRGRKKKNKGSTNYQKIKSYILRRHKRRTNVTNDAEATLVAKALYQYLKVNKKIIDGKITQKLIKTALDELYPQPQRKLGRLTVPEIPERLQEPNEYYNVEQVIDAMKEGLFRRVWIFSPMILGKRNNAWIYLSPTQTYKDWVDWINSEINDGTFKRDTPPDIWFRFKEVFYSSRNKRFEVKMISCDSDGNAFVTGYIPQGTSTVAQDDDNEEERFGVQPDEEEATQQPPISPLTPPIVQPTPPIAAPPPPLAEPKELSDAKLKTEADRQKSIRLDNLIKVKQSIMDDLRFNKEMGFPIEVEAIERLTAIRKEIDELSK